LVLALHEVVETDAKPQALSKTVFQNLCAYMRSREVWVATVAQVAEAVRAAQSSRRD
jgi:hypothetical protein